MQFLFGKGSTFMVDFPDKIVVYWSELRTQQMGTGLENIGDRPSIYKYHIPLYYIILCYIIYYVILYYIILHYVILYLGCFQKACGLYPKSSVYGASKFTTSFSNFFWNNPTSFAKLQLLCKVVFGNFFQLVLSLKVVKKKFSEISFNLFYH